MLVVRDYENKTMEKFGAFGVCVGRKWQQQQSPPKIHKNLAPANSQQSIFTLFHFGFFVRKHRDVCRSLASLDENQGTATDLIKFRSQRLRTKNPLHASEKGNVWVGGLDQRARLSCGVPERKWKWCGFFEFGKRDEISLLIESLL